jgi:hypothetical protein
MRTTVLVMLISGMALARQAPSSTLDLLWLDLASSDEAKAARAVLKLAAQGKEATAFLQKNLRPVKVDPKQVEKWIEQLDSDSFEERQAASDELEYLGKHGKPYFEKALEKKPSPEVKKRLQSLVDRIKAEEPIKEEDGGIPAAGGVSVTTINGKMTIRVGGKVIDLKPRVITKPGPLPAWQRAARAVAILESLGTPEARKLLEKLASGEEDALPTRAAKEALERLGK